MTEGCYEGEYFNCNAVLLIPGDRVLIGGKSGTVVRNLRVTRDPADYRTQVKCSLSIMPLHPDDTIEPTTILLEQTSTVKCMYDDPTSTTWIEG